LLNVWFEPTFAISLNMEAKVTFGYGCHVKPFKETIFTKWNGWSRVVWVYLFKIATTQA
jgi:hypothetical protein